MFKLEKKPRCGTLHQTVGRNSFFCKKNPKKGGKHENLFFWVSEPSFGYFWIVLRFWPKICMKNAGFFTKNGRRMRFWLIWKYHKLIKIEHFLVMKNFLERGYTMEGHLQNHCGRTLTRELLILGIRSL